MAAPTKPKQAIIIVMQWPGVGGGGGGGENQYSLSLSGKIYAECSNQSSNPFRITVGFNH